MKKINHRVVNIILLFVLLIFVSSISIGYSAINYELGISGNLVYDGRTLYRQIERSTTSVSNQNVLFANKCWKVISLEKTGGIRLIYNGEPDENDECPTTRFPHVGYEPRERIMLGSSYNETKNYKYSTDYVYDENSWTFELTGNIIQAEYSSSNSSSIVGRYTCLDATNSCSKLYYVESAINSSYANVYPLNDTTAYYLIGTSPYNEDAKIPSAAGYMHNRKYTNEIKEHSAKVGVIKNCKLTGTFSNYATWGSPNPFYYNLSPSITTTSGMDLAGKYTLLDNKTITDYATSNHVYYVISGKYGGDGRCLELTGGETMGSSYDAPSIKYGTGIEYIKETGEYDLTGVSSIDKLNWDDMDTQTYKKKHNELVGKYTCNGGYSCREPALITKTIDTDYYYTYAVKSLFGNSFTYNSTTGEYTLSGTTQLIDNLNTQYNQLEDTHYTCWEPNGKCKELSYVYAINDSNAHYINLKNGKNVSEALKEMLSNPDVNAENSTIKTMVDTWYSKNMTQYTKYLEDAVFCNNRVVSSLGGWDPNGGSPSQDSYLTFYSNGTCSKIDSFTVNSENGNGALTYPVGIPKASDTIFSGAAYWTMTPAHSLGGSVRGYFVASNSQSAFYYGNPYGVRPVISLRPGLKYASGNGTETNPYQIMED